MRPWVPTTHDWTSDVDVTHLRAIRADAARYAPGGLLHLVLEALAYPADEAAATGTGSCEVVMHPDGSVSVADDGRGTDTRYDADGRPVRKPVMATPDLRFFTAEHPPLLADGRPRRGMSVVAALSMWLEHTNRRSDGAWTQRYEAGVPVGDLAPVPADGRTGTMVRFHPDCSLLADCRLRVEDVEALVRRLDGPLRVTVREDVTAG